MRSWYCSKVAKKKPEFPNYRLHTEFNLLNDHFLCLHCYLVSQYSRLSRVNVLFGGWGGIKLASSSLIFFPPTNVYMSDLRVAAFSTHLCGITVAGLVLIGSIVLLVLWLRTEVVSNGFRELRIALGAFLLVSGKMKQK